MNKNNSLDDLKSLPIITQQKNHIRSLSFETKYKKSLLNRYMKSLDYNNKSNESSSLKNVLTNDKLNKDFIKYCESTHNDENVYFYLETILFEKEFNTNNTIVNINNAKEIIDRFINIINIEHSVKNEILNNYQNNN